MDKIEFRDRLKQALAEGKVTAINEMYQSLNYNQKPGFIGNALRIIISDIGGDLSQYGYRVEFPSVPQSWFYCSIVRGEGIRAAQIFIPATSDNTLGVNGIVSPTNTAMSNGYEDILPLSWEEFIGSAQLINFVENLMVAIVKAFPYTPEEISNGPDVF